MSQIPNTVYRYRAFSSSTIDLLCNDEQFFSNPSNFNDPFDCSPQVVIDSDLTQLQKILTSLVAARVHAETLAAFSNAKFKEPLALAHAKEISRSEALKAVQYVQYHATNPDYDDPTAAEISMLRQEIQIELLGRYGKGICCFSEEYNNPLLWSHYGEQHRGLCIGYSVDRTPAPELKRVRYGGNRTITTSLLERALLTKKPDGIEELDASVLLRKAPEWEYEKEWRLIGKVGLQESPLKLTEVTFGLRCSAAVRHAVMTSLAKRQNTVDFFEMVNVFGTFNLQRSPVDEEDTMFLPNTAMSAMEAFPDHNET